jgi:hypothetical protein
MKKIILLYGAFSIIITGYACKEKLKKNETYVSLLKDKNICINDKLIQPIYYKHILFYSVAENGNIVISNSKSDKLDIYSESGKYMYSVGEKGNGPGEFSQEVSHFKVFNKKIFAFDFKNDCINVFNENGRFLLQRKKSELKINGYITKFCSCADKLIIYYTDTKNYWIDILDEELNLKKRFRTSICDRHMPILFFSDIDVDKNGEIYVTDNYDYVIYVYNIEGKEVNYIKKSMNKTKILEKDFIMYDFNGRMISVHPNAGRLRNAEKEDRFWPCITGINIDKNRIFVWTSETTDNRELLVDIYDKEWKLKCKVSCENWILQNFVQIKNGKLYALSMTNQFPLEISRNLGKLGCYGIPEKLCVYAIPEWIYN